jgi:hypothetical protein
MFLAADDMRPGDTWEEFGRECRLVSVGVGEHLMARMTVIDVETGGTFFVDLLPSNRRFVQRST